MSTGVLRSRTAQLGLGICNFGFPNWGDEANNNMDILDAAFGLFGIQIRGMWEHNTSYLPGEVVIDTVTNNLYRAQIAHTSAATGTFAADRAANPTFWVEALNPLHARGQWLTATAYVVNDIVFDGYVWAIAADNFTSRATLALDIAAGDFLVISDLSTAVADAEAAAADAWQAANNLIILTMAWYGAVSAGGTVPDHTAFVAAAASGRTVRVDTPTVGTFYSLTSVVTMSSGTKFVGDGNRPEIRAIGTPGLFSMLNATDAALRGLTLNGNKAGVVGTAAPIVLLGSSTSCIVEDCLIKNSTLYGSGIGDLLLSTAQKCKVRNNEFVDAGGAAMGITGSATQYNEVTFNSFTGSGIFGCRIGEQAHHNLFAFNRTNSNGAELCGITKGCEHNRIIGNHAEGTGDGGISVSGDHNTVVGNTCRGNAYSGIQVWGKYNVITGNNCTNNSQSGAGGHGGIVIFNGFGNFGQFNMVSGNIVDDDQVAPTQDYGISVNTLAYPYTLWAAGQVISQYQYRYFGINLYQAVDAVPGTTGAVAPVHTSGVVSDGTVNWTYIDTSEVAGTVLACRNFISGNLVTRSVIANYFGSATTNTFMTGIHGDVNSQVLVGTNTGTTGISTGQLVVGDEATANQGMVVKSSGLGRIGFWDTAQAASITYDHATGDMTFVVEGKGVLPHITTPAGTATLASLKETVGVLLTAPVSGAHEYDGKAFYQMTLTGRGVVPTVSFVKVRTAVALSNSSTSAQNVFESGADEITVKAATTYRFRGKIDLNTGNVSHTTAFGFGGTATIGHCYYTSTVISAAVLVPTAPQVTRVSSAAAIVLNAASTAIQTSILLEGTFEISADGTIIPQITFSAGPTGTCETALLSFFEIWPIGINTVTSVGPLS